MKILSQYENEHKAWQRSLEFFRQENALLKYRLSEMVDNNEEKSFLQLAEYFQNELLLKDEMMDKLMKQLNLFSAQFQGLESSKMLTERMIARQDKLRNDIVNFEEQALHLSRQFNEKMLQSI